MNEAKTLAREVLNMRSLQIEYSKIVQANKYRVYRKVDGEELAKAYSEMRGAEQKVHRMCLDIVRVDEEVDYD